MTDEEVKDTIVYIATTRTFTDSFGEEMGIDEEVAKGLADALIAAGLTFEPMTFRIVENKPYSYSAAELANWKEDQECIAKLEHRAEVAERALKIAEDLGELCAPVEDYINQAEKELAEEGKND